MVFRENMPTIEAVYPDDSKEVKDIDEKQKESKIVIFGLDDASGRDYLKTFCEAMGIDESMVDYRLIEVPPRVVNGELNPQPNNVSGEVTWGLVSYLKDSNFEFGSNSTVLEKKPVIVTIGCNTVGVKEYQTLTERKLREPPYNLRHGEDYIFLTPVSAIIADAEARSRKVPPQPKPLFLGTRVTSKDLADEVPTFFSENIKYANGEEMEEAEKDYAARLVQQCIWLDKKINGSEVPSFYKTITTEQAKKELTANIELLIKLFKLLGTKEVYLGCTELPDAFKNYCPEDLRKFMEEEITFINPAMLVAQQAKEIQELYNQ